MKKLMSMLLVLSLVGSPVAFAQEAEVTNVDRAAGVGVAGVWGAATASVTGGLAASWCEYSAMGVIAFGIIGGITREIQTDPRKYGRYQYSGQPEAAGRENKKWRHSKTSLWNELVDYEAEGPGADKIPFSTGLTTQIPSTFVPTVE